MSIRVDYFYREVNTREEYIYILDMIKPDIIIYNYHWDRMPWLLDYDMKNKNYKHYFIYHDGSVVEEYDKYLFCPIFF
jgi:hypothetical protein